MLDELARLVDEYPEPPQGAFLALEGLLAVRMPLEDRRRLVV
jgi:hypothetical protein